MEVAGVVIGGIGLAALFDSVVHCVDYTYIGTNFERDSRTAQLRLEDTRTRIRRWGRAVGVDSEQTARTRLGPNYESAEIRLCQIKRYYDEAHARSQLYLREHPNINPLLTLDSTTLRTEGCVRKALRRVYRPTQAFGKRATWALYEHDVLNRLIDNVNELIDGLELIAPIEELSHLADIEVEAIDDPYAIREMAEANAQDQVLQDAVSRLGHSYARTQNMERAKVLMGDMIMAEALQVGMADIGRKHVYTDTTNGRDAKVVMGNVIGSKENFWMD